MANFLFIYRQAVDSHQDMSPEQRQQHYQKWQVWIQNGMQKGWMLNPGDGLKKEGCTVNAKAMVTDGPFIEAKEIVGGFAIVEAETARDAAEFAKDCPCLLIGGSVEVRPLEGFKLV